MKWIAFSLVSQHFRFQCWGAGGMGRAVHYGTAPPAQRLWTPFSACASLYAVKFTHHMKNRKPDNPDEFIKNTDSRSICHTLKKKNHISGSLATSILFYNSETILFIDSAFRSPIRYRHRNMADVAWTGIEEWSTAISDALILSSLTKWNCDSLLNDRLIFFFKS